MAKRKSILSNQEQEVLTEDLLLMEMVNSKGWQEVYKPFLLEKLNQSFPDPSQFTSDEAFIYAARVASVFKKVIAELLGWADGKIAEVQMLQAKEKNKIADPFKIGGE